MIPTTPPGHRQLLYLTLACGLLCPVALLVLDKPLALWLHQYPQSQPFFAVITLGLDRVVNALFFFAYVGPLPAGFVAFVLMFLLARFGLRASSAGVFLLVPLTYLNSAAAANLLKIYFQRPRPTVFLTQGMVGTGLWQAATHNFSFPSSHTAIYFSLLLPVAWQFPRFWWPWLVMPSLVGIGRLVLEEHFLSDVLAAVFLVGVILRLLSRLPFITPRSPSRCRPYSPSRPAGAEEQGTVIAAPSITMEKKSASQATPSETREPAQGSRAGGTNWRAWYWLVLGALAVEIGLMTYVTRLFA